MHDYTVVRKLCLYYVSCVSINNCVNVIVWFCTGRTLIRSD
jgi:hypothetical protein